MPFLPLRRQRYRGEWKDTSSGSEWLPVGALLVACPTHGSLAVGGNELNMSSDRGNRLDAQCCFRTVKTGYAAWGGKKENPDATTHREFLLSDHIWCDQGEAGELLESLSKKRPRRQRKMVETGLRHPVWFGNPLSVRNCKQLRPALTHRDHPNIDGVHFSKAVGTAFVNSWPTMLK